MSSVLSEYPETLPAPMVGVVAPTERRKVGSIGGVQSFRTVQRDRHGVRTYAFTFTKEQAAIFRDWWAEWEQLGGGWFAANWPLPWSRGPNVFRFKNPPEWSLIGGGIDGQGYWRASGALEIRGRGMLPTVEVMYLTSQPYPIYYFDDMRSNTTNFSVLPNYSYSEDIDSQLSISSIEVNGNIYSNINYSIENIYLENISILEITKTETVYKDISAPIEGMNNKLAIEEIISARVVIGYLYPVESTEVFASIVSIGS